LLLELETLEYASRNVKEQSEFDWGLARLAERNHLLRLAFLF
jgi:hypothetical protein